MRCNCCKHKAKGEDLDQVKLVLTRHQGGASIVILHSCGGGRVVRRCWVNFQCRGILLIRIIVGQGPTGLPVGADGDCCLDIFFSSIISSFSLSLGDGPV